MSLGFVLLGITIAAPVSALGWYSLLPLLATYPLATSIIGWDPIYDLFDGESRHDGGKLRSCSRVELAITGLVLVCSIFVLPVFATSEFIYLHRPVFFPTIAPLTGNDLLQSHYIEEVSHREVNIDKPKNVT